MIRHSVRTFIRKDEYTEVVERHDYTFLGILIFRTDKIIKSNM